MKREKKRGLALALALLLAGAAVICALLRWDNKYTAALPGGPGYNVLQADAEQVAFLVDGWEAYPGLRTPQELENMFWYSTRYTYAGEYPNFSYLTGDPYGQVTYRLTLADPEGGGRSLALYLPELLCAGRVYINGELVGEQGSLSPYRPHVTDAVYPFRSGERTELVIQCANYTHYYSGLYYPPGVGTPNAVQGMVAARLAVYGLMCFLSLGLALSGLAMWLFDRDRQSFRLGLLCLCFSLRVCYPFLRAMGAPLVRPLYALEDFCASAALMLAILLAGELSGAAVRWYHRRVALPATATLCAVTVVFPLFILPYAPLFINTYGVVLFLWKLLSGGYLVFLALRGLGEERPLWRYLLCASGLYGLSLAAGALSYGRFEPIRGAWLEEYGGFALVLGFAALTVRAQVNMIGENQRLNLHLQSEVDRKTSTLEALLQERRMLLAHLIHDMKNPLAALKNYAQLIQSGALAVDSETAAYLEALNERVNVLEGRFELLQGFSRAERGMAPAERICLNDFLRRFHADNRPDMELSGQLFHLELPREELSIDGDEERLRSALENLCYNALSFTPEDGSVTLALTREGDQAAIWVKDTGCGIRPEDLPHVFEYGFTRRVGGGEGLGLYIVQSVAMELGGTVEASSELGKGSVFVMRAPLAP